MLLQHILHQLDGELVRLKSLRKVVAGLGKSPAIVRTLVPRIAKLREAKPQGLLAEALPNSRPAQRREPRADPGPEQGVEPRRRGRPRKNAEVAPPAKVRTPRATRQAEPTALAKSVPRGPVVVSAAALAQEREKRATAKAAAPEQDRKAAREGVRPESFARELAARWLAPASKA